MIRMNQTRGIEAESRLRTESIGRLMLRMGIPTLVAQLINLLYNMVDRIYIGHIKDVGATALTGVGVSLPVILIITAFSNFVGSGGAPLAAIALGRGDRDRAETILGNGVTLLIAFSAALTAGFLIFKKPFLYMVGASDATYPYADEYITIYLWGTLFVQLTMGLNTFITAQGQSRIAMLSVVIGAVLNIILDPVFIFALNMGVRGAALATILSQAVSAVWVITFLTHKNTALRLKWVRLKPQWHILGSIAALGVSPFIMQATESLISIVMNKGLYVYGGDIYVGSLTVLQSVMQLIWLPMNGFMQGVQPIMSYNYGAGDVHRVRDTFRRSLIICVISAFVLTLSAILLPGMYARVFTEDAALIALVEEALPIFIFGMLFIGVQNACQSTFMALGQARLSLFIALLRKVILLVPLAILLPRFTGEVMSIYFAEPISDTISVIVCGTLFMLNFKKILSHCKEAL